MPINKISSVLARRWLAGFVASWLVLASPSASQAQNPGEAPSLAKLVAAGKLPPLSERLPENPERSDFTRDGKKLGQYGGDLRLLFAKARDLRMLGVYGYARLVGYRPDLSIAPDILESLDIEDGGRQYTLHLRKGHRWSDGAPFTSEDFRFYWQDVLHNTELTPEGLPDSLLVDELPPEFEVIDETTIRYRWQGAHPSFPILLAGAAPLKLFMPARHLKKLHEQYTDAETIQRQVTDNNARNWVQLFLRNSKVDRFSTHELPTLQPWRLVTPHPSKRFIFERNPYFHRVDPKGRQLPYIDRVVVTITEGRLLAAKAGSGDADLAARGIRFDNFTFLRSVMKDNGFRCVLWRSGRGANLALYPNMNSRDPVMRKLFRDVRFRRALSLAINRKEINQVIYYGLNIEGNNTLLPESPLHVPENRAAWAKFDIDQANELLDAVGLTKRRGGIRLLPDGSKLEIVVESDGEDSERIDVLSLIHDSWLKAGVKLFARPSQRDVLRNRIFAGSSQMVIGVGIENGFATHTNAPAEFVPSSQLQAQWPRWGHYIESGGRHGEAPDMDWAIELLALGKSWARTEGDAAKSRIWREILSIHSEQVPSIGLTAGKRQPVVIANRVRNVPEDGFYNWDPGAFFGIYRPDSFWLDDASVQQ